MALTDKQRRYRNNFHRGNYVCGGEVLASEDNTVTGEEFILTSIPKGVFVNDVIVIIETTGTAPTFTVTDENGNINVTSENKTEINKFYEDSEKIKLSLGADLTDGRLVVLFSYIDPDVTTGGRVVAKV